MKRLAAAGLLLVLVSGCASTNPMSMVNSLASNPLVSSLRSSLGLSASQAVGGAGAMLGLAENKLAKADWSKIAAAIPSTKDLIKTASTLGGITSKADSMSDLTGPFSKIGLSPDQVTKMVPAMTDYVGKAAGPEVGGALASVLK